MEGCWDYSWSLQNFVMHMAKLLELWSTAVKKGKVQVRLLKPFDILTVLKI